MNNNTNKNDDSSNESNDQSKQIYDWDDPDTIFKFLDDYKIGSYLLVNQQVSDLKKVATRLKELQQLARQNAKDDKDGINKLVELHKLIANEIKQNYALIKSRQASYDTFILTNVWEDMYVNLKELIERFYWRNGNKDYIRISDSAYKASLLFAGYNEIFKEKAPIDLTSNHNDRSVRITYHLRELFKNGEVLMSEHPHGVDAVVCYKNDRGEIADENNNVIPNNEIDSYVNNCLKQKSGLIKLNTEYKTIADESVVPESIINGLIWFSNITPSKDIPPMDCFVYSMISKYNEFVQFTFVIKNKQHMQWFNDLLVLIRKLYSLLHKFGNTFTTDEVLIYKRKRNSKNQENEDGILNLVSDFDCTDMWVWMLYKCNIFYQTEIKNNKAQWSSSEISLRDALIKRFEYYKLPEIVDALDENVKNEFNDYIQSYEIKIEKAKSYLIGRSFVLFPNDPIKKAEFDIRINNYIQTLTNTLTKLKNHLIKMNPELEQTNDHKITK